MWRPQRLLLDPTRFFHVWRSPPSSGKWTVGVPICFVASYGFVHGSIALKALGEMLQLCDEMVDAHSLLPKLAPPAYATATTTALGYILFLTSAAILSGCIALVLDYHCSFRFLLASAALTTILYTPSILLAVALSNAVPYPVLLSCPHSYVDLPAVAGLAGSLIRKSPGFIFLRVVELLCTAGATILIVAATEAHVRWPKTHSICAGASLLLLLGVLAW